ncbi:hypothetical protein BHE74_00015792 [Ensete ventricosum]|nr:hypothetical protein GW17_00016687 [Ensete ventricosum]RWW76140.1 hypothetical protein BHE74_00015792 [Ensete ventricosum]RZS19138.1 hypothetical protein BHM03_00051493 [Ensete ventricosum]
MRIFCDGTLVCTEERRVKEEEEVVKEKEEEGGRGRKNRSCWKEEDEGRTGEDDREWRKKMSEGKRQGRGGSVVGDRGVSASGQNMRQMLAPIILRLLGKRLVYENADVCPSTIHMDPLKREFDFPIEASLLDHSSDSLFDRLLAVLHGLLSSYKASWLKFKSVTKSAVKPPRDISAFDREAAENLQLPASIRWRIQTAMPFLSPSLPISAPCHLPVLPSVALTSLQPSNLNPGPHQRILPAWTCNLPGKSKSSAFQDMDIENDPWTLLEGGTNSASASNNSSNMGSTNGDHSNLKACCWLKGTVRVRRTDLTYIGPLDEES